MIENNEQVQEQPPLIFIKLITGEEIIATWLKETDDEVIVNEPVEFKRMIGRELNVTAIGTLNYTFFLTEHELNLRKSDIMFMSDKIVEPFVKYYDQFLNNNPQSQRNLFKEPTVQQQQEAEAIEIEVPETNYEQILNMLEPPVSNNELH